MDSDRGVPVWVPLLVVVVAVGLLLLPGWYLLDWLQNQDWTSNEVAAPTTSAVVGTTQPAPDTTLENPSVLTVAQDTVLDSDRYGRIVVVASGVTLDCDGHTIFGPGGATGLPGITMSGVTGVTVKNCRLTQFNDGFRVEQTSESQFLNNEVNDVRQGFTFLGSDDNTLMGNVVSDANDWFGYGFFDGSARNQIIGNEALSVQGVGFMLTNAYDNLFEDNNASNNYGNGFGANPPAAGNIYTNNTAVGNTQHGIEDNTSGGTGDGRTNNYYSKNICTMNEGASSKPDGLCDL